MLESSGSYEGQQRAQYPVPRMLRKEATVLLIRDLPGPDSNGMS